MPASSNVEICNSALSLIGQESIVSLNENKPGARQCKANFDPCRRSVLVAHDWTFAEARVTTAAETDTPAFNFTYQHALPSDCLRIRSVNKSPEPSELWRPAGRKILTDDSTLYVVYTKDEKDPKVFEDQFADALAHYIAWKICVAMIQGNTGRNLKNQIMQDYRMVLSAAKASDYQSKQAQFADTFDQDDARRIGIDQSRPLA